MNNRFINEIERAKKMGKMSLYISIGVGVIMIIHLVSFYLF